ETRVKNVCRDFGIRIAYKPDPKDVKTDQLWRGIQERQAERQATGKVDFIPAPLMADVETVRSAILNRFAHPGVPTFDPAEVKFAFETIQKLCHHQFTKI